MKVDDVYIRTGKNYLSICYLKEITSHSYKKEQLEVLNNLGVAPYEDDLITTDEYILNKVVNNNILSRKMDHVFSGDFHLMIKNDVYKKMDKHDFTKFLLSFDDFKLISLDNNSILGDFFNYFMEKYGKERVALHPSTTSI